MKNTVTPGDAQATPSLRVYNIEQAAELFGMKKATFANRVKAGVFPQPIRLSPRRPVWRESDLAAFIAKL
jgi:predicted DNA-binding transcriptional regulator AlpA